MITNVPSFEKGSSGVMLSNHSNSWGACLHQVTAT